MQSFPNLYTSRRVARREPLYKANAGLLILVPVGAAWCHSRLCRFALVACLGFHALGSSHAQDALSPMDILSYFQAERQEALTYSAKIEIFEARTAGLPGLPPGQWRKVVDFIDDGERYRASWNRYSLGNEEETQLSKASTMWDGNQHWILVDTTASSPSMYRKGDPTHMLLLAEDQPRSRKEVAMNFLGYDPRGMFRDDREYLYDLMADAGNLAGGEMQDVSGHPCYRLTASTEYADYEIWIDPAVGYQLRKARVSSSFEQVKAKRLSTLEASGLPESVLDVLRKAPNQRHTYVLDDVTFEQFGDHFAATSYIMTSTVDIDDGGHSEYEEIYILSDLAFGDQLVSEDTFRLDVPEGTRVTREGENHIEYEWRNGRVVPYVKPAELAELAEAAASLNLEGAPPSQAAQEAPPSPKTIASTETDEDPGRSRHNTFAIVLGLSILALLAVGLWSYTRKSS